MIKRIRFATRALGVSAETFSAGWPGALATAAQAPPDVRPSRVAVCVTLPDLTGPNPKHDGIGIEWFADVGHLGRFEKWLSSGELNAVGALADPAASPVVIADEAVMRGAGWLEQRWRDGGEKFKHMATAMRATGLTPEEFSLRWRGHAGTVRRAGAARAAVIPDGARGRAYVQNHPRLRPVGEWAYDAVNEVYFDDAESLRTRIEWFRANVLAPAGDGLFGQSWFIAAREEVLA